MEHPLKQWRADHNLTLKQASDATGVSPTSLHRYENNERLPKPKDMEKLNQTTGLTAEILAAAFYAAQKNVASPHKEESACQSP